MPWKKLLANVAGTATIGKQLGRKALEAIATVVKPEIILRRACQTGGQQVRQSQLQVISWKTFCIYGSGNTHSEIRPGDPKLGVPCFGLVTYYILFFIHLGTCKIHIAGITPNPHREWVAAPALAGRAPAWQDDVQSGRALFLVR